MRLTGSPSGRCALINFRVRQGFCRARHCQGAPGAPRSGSKRLMRRRPMAIRFVAWLRGARSSGLAVPLNWLARFWAPYRDGGRSADLRACDEIRAHGGDSASALFARQPCGAHKVNA
jgi:hypothetical protein